MASSEESSVAENIADGFELLYGQKTSVLSDLDDISDSMQAVLYETIQRKSTRTISRMTGLKRDTVTTYQSNLRAKGFLERLTRGSYLPTEKGEKFAEIYEPGTGVVDYYKQLCEKENVSIPRSARRPPLTSEDAFGVAAKLLAEQGEASYIDLGVEVAREISRGEKATDAAIRDAGKVLQRMKYHDDFEYDPEEDIFSVV